MKAGDVYHVITYPYKRGDHHVVVGRAPQGAILMRGPKSAFRTAKTLYGKAPSKALYIDMGFQDIKISPDGGDIELSYRPDPSLSTRGDINVSGRRGVFPLGKG